ncbi:hypothetical protein Nizo3894_2308 [Lactiplantibacillus plantarum]|uniref:Uncharacterized protein n=1 Tax=Lactiplantibacillus plantarum TaxID=1590 RepID=A0A165QVZ7_LACPN|nr:hypothetical protein Nizo3894_2308 [Lactiplantibacillus plantarum]KZU91486.1 hypothetical protein Lp19_2772 [Lactiplantibacillus plantarum]
MLNLKLAVTWFNQRKWLSWRHSAVIEFETASWPLVKRTD